MKNGAKKNFVTQMKLAEERTLLANERTTLSYITTGLSAFVLGFGLIKLFEDYPTIVYWGFGSIILGFFFIFLGLVNYAIRKKRIESHTL